MEFFLKVFKVMMMKHFRRDFCKVQTLIRHLSDSFRSIYTREELECMFQTLAMMLHSLLSRLTVVIKNITRITIADKCRVVLHLSFKSPVSNNLLDFFDDKNRNQAVINFSFMFSLLLVTLVLSFRFCLRHQFPFRSIWGATKAKYTLLQCWICMIKCCKLKERYIF